MFIAAMHDKQILFESETIIVIGLENREHPDSTVFVTFNEYGFAPAENHFWGEVLFAKLPNSAIGIVSKSPNWYPAADMQAALPFILAAIRGRAVITYGHSQGGYGALKYAAAFNASAALAFCPQWSINPDDVAAFDKRFTGNFFATLDNGQAITAADLAPNSFAFFDPYQMEDAANIEKMLGFAGLYPVICPFSGHETVRLISDARMGAAFLEMVDTRLQAGIQAHTLARELRGLLRAARPKSPCYSRNKTMTLERGQKLKQRDAVVSAIPDHARLRLAIKRNDVAEANRMLLSLPFGAIETFGVIEAWMYAREEQLQTAEMRLASLIIDFCPNQPFLLLHAVNSFMGQGMARNAAILLQDIVSRFGIRDQMQAGHIANFAAALDLPLLREQAQENLRRTG